MKNSLVLSTRGHMLCPLIASSRVSPMVFESCFTASGQFYRSLPLVHHVCSGSHCMACLLSCHMPKTISVIFLRVFLPVCAVLSVCGRFLLVRCHHRVSVRLPVRLSHAQYCVKTAKHRITQTTPRDSSGTLVFWRQRLLVGDAPLPLKIGLKVTHPLTCPCGRVVSALGRHVQ